MVGGGTEVIAAPSDFIFIVQFSTEIGVPFEEVPSSKAKGGTLYTGTFPQAITFDCCIPIVNVTSCAPPLISKS